MDCEESKFLKIKEKNRKANVNFFNKFSISFNPFKF